MNAQIATYRAVFRLLLLSLAVSFLGPAALAQATFTWNGSASNAWTNAANWTPSAVPGATDTAVIPGGTANSPSITANTAIANLSVQTGAALRVLGNSTIGNVTLTVDNGFTNHGTIELSNTQANWFGHLVVTAGTLINEGTLHATGLGTGTRDLTAELDNRGTLQVDRHLRINKAGAVHKSSGTVSIADNITLSIVNSTLEYDGGSWVGADGLLDLSGVTLTLVAAFENPQLNRLAMTSSTIVGPQDFVVSEGQTLLLRLSTFNANLENRGLLEVDRNNTIAGGFSNEATGVVQVLGNSSIGNVTLTVDNGFTNHGTIELSNTQASWFGHLVVTSGTLINEGTLHATGLGTGTRDLTAELDNRGTLQVDRHLRINKAGAIHRNSGVIDLSGGNLTIDQTGELAATLLNGTTTVAPGSTLSISGSTVFIQSGLVTGVEPEILEETGGFSLTNTTLNLTPDFAVAHLHVAINNTVVFGPGNVFVNAGSMITLSQATFNANLENHGVIAVMRDSQLSSETFSNEGPGALRVVGNSSIGNVRLTVANGFTNRGTVDLTNSASSWFGHLTVTSGTLVNDGALHATGQGTGVSELAAELDNRGSLRVERALTVNQPGAMHANTGKIAVVGGNLIFNLSVDGAEFENAGPITVHKGQVLTFTGGSMTHAQGGVFHGGGTVSISGTSVNNSGSLAPGLRPMFGHNLIVNADAELGPVGSSSANVAITGWQDAGPMSILPYDFEDGSQPYLASSDPGPDDRGAQYFWGGVGPSSTITQTINLADIRSLVDLGTVTYELSGWLGGFTVQNDQMQLTASFRDGDSEELAVATLGPVTAADREFVTSLLLREADGVVPAGTRSVLLTMTATRFAGTANNAFADDFSLILNHPAGAGEGRTPDVLSLTGDLPMDPTAARVEIGIGGLVLGEQYDQVAVSGSATLGGALFVDLLNDFLPAVNDAFVVMTFADRTGEFSSVVVKGLPEGLFLVPEYGATSVVLRASGEAPPLTAPALLQPAHGATEVPIETALVWSAVGGAAHYHVQLAEDAHFDDIVFEQEELAQTSVEVGPLAHETPHWWRVRAANAGEQGPWSPVFSFTTAPAVGTDGGPEDPLAFRLDVNYPNPFAGQTTIRFGVAEDSEVRLEVFDLLGRRVGVLAEGPFAAGYHDVRLDARDLPSGAYVYRLIASEFVAVRKMLLVRR